MTIRRKVIPLLLASDDLLAPQHVAAALQLVRGS
jgi:hypothetical protein